MIKIKVMLRKTKNGGFTSSRKDIQKIRKLNHQKKKFEIEYVFDKFTPR